MTCRIKRCYAHVSAPYLDQIFSPCFKIASCRAADAILPPACCSRPPQTAGRTRPPTPPGKLSGFSDVSQRNLALRGDGGGVFPSLGGRRPWPLQSASPARLPSLVPSCRSSAVAPFLIPPVRPPASCPPPRPSVRLLTLLPPPPLPPPIISVCLLLSLRVDGRTDLQ